MIKTETEVKTVSISAQSEKIRAYLPEKYRSFEIITKKEVGSTNDEAKKLALTEKEKSIIYIAESQTKGKGRLGRNFFSPAKTGIYMSILLHPRLKAEECTLLTPAAAVAVCKALEKTAEIKADIKWVNDVYIGGKKVAGILTESAFDKGKICYCIVGIGINLSPPENDFPEEIRNIASSVLPESDEDTKNRLIAEVVSAFMECYEALPKVNFFDHYRNRLLYLGEKITVFSPDGDYEAAAKDIDERFRLIIEKEDGEEGIIGSGEISVRSKR